MTRPVLTINVQGALDKFTALERQQEPFARARALTNTARWCQWRLTEEMRRCLDRPTPYTQSALYIVPAKKADGAAMQARVKVKDQASKGNPASAYLFAEVEGGNRRAKGFELQLQRVGVLPRGWYAVPGESAPLDAYGNLETATLLKILSQVQSNYARKEKQSLTARRNRNMMQQRYFAVSDVDSAQMGIKPGIWERMGGNRNSRIRPVLIFTPKQPRYSKRFRFYELAQEWARERFPIEFEAAMQYALATAK